MEFPPAAKARLSEIFAAPLVSTLRTRTTTTSPDEERERSNRPLHFALVPPAVWKGSKFERSFVTSLGNVWEKAAVEASRGLSSWMQQSYLYEGEIYSEQVRVITKILADLEALRRRPDWGSEIREVFAAASGATERCQVRADVAIGKSAAEMVSHEYFEIKSPMPNSDQTKVSKEKMLKLTAMEGRECAFFALPFNPWELGRRTTTPFRSVGSTWPRTRSSSSETSFGNGSEAPAPGRHLSRLRVRLERSTPKR